MLVLDGNIKNAPQFCSCRGVGELKFAGMDGSVAIISSNLIVMFGHTVFTVRLHKIALKLEDYLM